ncbi:GIY-YIG nuclease family protein [Radicibacter daui]|uniref:GIY-YIG nuclease family protein n=1 Tax=Radicibacter daui TaxID=3064829 RepID=UPI0040470171
MTSEAAGHFVYVLLTADGQLAYTGYSTDPERRLAEHNGGRKAGGARFTAGRGPWQLAWISEPYASKAEALVAELQLKHNRAFKARLKKEFLASGPISGL